MERLAKIWHGPVMRDAIDIALANMIQRDALATAHELAAAIALSPSALARRLRTLRANGAITGHYAMLTPQLTERRLRAMIDVRFTEHADRAAINDLHARLSMSEDVQLLTEVAGEVDLMMLVVCRDMRAYNDFAARMLESAPIVRRFETRFVKRLLKQDSFVRLHHDDLPSDHAATTLRNTAR